MSNWLQKFQDMRAIWQLGSPDHPHIKTSMSGQHVDVYFNSDLVTSCPDVIDDIIETVLLPAIKDEGPKPTWVVGYAP